MKLRFNFTFEKATNFLKKYHFWILGLILLILLCCNALVYYNHVYLTMNAKVMPADGKVSIDEETVEKITNIIIQREETLVRVKTKDYFNPFDD